MTTQNRTKTALTLAAVAMAILVLTATSANAGDISYVQVTNDADSGISADNTYTHKLDFGTGSPGALINGVQFDAYNNAANGTLNFNREVSSGNLSDHGGNGGHNVSGSLVDLMTDMYYNGNNAVGGTTTWTLSGLTAGMTYDARIYTRQWGVSTRTATIVFDPDGGGAISDSTGLINEDDATSAGFTNANDAYYINYRFKAVAGEDLVITATQDFLNQSWHLYGLSNQEAILPKTASHPDPADGSRTSPAGVEGAYYMLMTFTAGHGATTHTAYFSSNFEDVDDRNPAVSLGSPPYPGMYPTGYYAGLDDPAVPEFARTPLERGETYYWAVDESNDTDSYPGDVWSYTIASESAWDPTPADGAVMVPSDTTLSWMLGDLDIDGYTVRYLVYVGTDETAVEAIATGNTTAPEYVGTPLEPTSFDITGLAGETEIFWRVDTKRMLSLPPFPTFYTKGEVWSFETLPEIPDVNIVDPNLVGWWKLDGDITFWMAFDSSGYGNHGEFYGDPAFVPGQLDNALDFDGIDDCVDIAYSPELSLNEFTASAWVNIASEAVNYGILGTRFGGDTTFDFKVRAADIHGDIGNGTAWIDTNLDIGSGDTGANGQGGDLALDTWYMIAYVIDNANQQVRLYLDGDLKRTIDISGMPLLMKAGQSMRIGNSSGAEWMNGLIDDVRIYNKALSAKEIKILAGLLAASGPIPADGATDVTRTPTLSWTPGVYAAATDGSVVYYSEDENAVINRTAPSATLSTPSFPVPTPLDLGTVFYWAVDTVNGVDTWPGDVWSFTVVNWIPVDDMESYTPWTTPGNNIFEIWLDGFGDCAGSGNTTGAVLTENADPVLGGVQSMKYDFDNDGTVFSPCDSAQIGGRLMYSKIEVQTSDLVSGIGSDWTVEGVKALSIPFHGQAGNATTEPFWVQLKDGSGYGEKVFYGDYEGESLDDFNEAVWHTWNIDMAEFDVDLTNVVSVVIGIGNEDGSGAHGSGTLYIDDIRLYTPSCRPDRAKPAADFDNSCKVDYPDVAALFDAWLLQDLEETVWSGGAWTSTDIGDVDVPGSFTDLGGGAYTITGRGADIWGTDDAFLYAYKPLSGDGQMTVRVTGIGGPSVNDWRKAGIMIRETLDPNSSHAFMAITPAGGGGSSFQWRSTLDGDNNNQDGPAGVTIPQCIRLLRVGDQFRAFRYVNGEWAQAGGPVTVPMAEDVLIGLAVTSHNVATMCTATFDRVCSEDFIAIDLVEDSVINFEDYAELMNQWMDEVFWP